MGRKTENKVNNNNIDLALTEFIDFCKPEDKEVFNLEYLGDNTRKIYQMLLDFKNKK